MNLLIDLAMRCAMMVAGTIGKLNRQTIAESDLVDAIKNESIVNIEQYCYGDRLYDILRTPLKIPESFEEEMAMSYGEYVVYLLNKYGQAKYNYFFNSTCSTKDRRIERFNEGLFCHHIAEECGVRLKTMTEIKYARSKPIELFDSKHFIYANYFEHLLLHIKIAQEDSVINANIPIGVDLIGARLIWRELSRFYETGKVPMHHKKASEMIANKYDEYLNILKYLLQDDKLSKYVNIEDFSLDNSGIKLPKIFNDLGGNDQS